MNSDCVCNQRSCTSIAKTILIYFFSLQAIDRINASAQKFISLPNRAQTEEIAHALEVKSGGMPNVCGIMDGCVIPILTKPPRSGHDYVSRKGTLKWCKLKKSDDAYH